MCKSCLAEADKTSAFTFSQEIIDAVLTRGSGIEEGKMRIYEQFSKSLSAKENADFLREEYGWGGSYPVIIGTGIDEGHDGKGIALSRGMGNDKQHILLNWNQVAKRINELISADRYLNPKEKEHYPEWLQKQEERRAALEEQRQNREILSTAPPEQVNNTAEQQNDTSEQGSNATDELIGKEVTIDDHRFVIESVGSFSGDVSMRDVTMQGQRIPINRVEKIGYVRRLLEEQEKAANTKYEYHLGDSVYIGASQYEILSFDDNRVMLYDFEYPLFNKEFSRDEFDRKVRENPMNDHLIAKDESAEEKEEAPITEVETNMGTMPIEDYREVVASQAGYDSYDEMYDEGIRIGNGYDKEPEPEEKEVTVEPTETPTAEPTTEVTGEPIAPKWEQKKKPNSFDLHPDIPLSDRHTFDLKSNPVEEVGKKERFRRNIMAIQLLKKCQEENRFATAEEQQILSKYVGWGGLSEAFDENNSAWRTEYLELSTVLTPEEYASARESTLTAFYTPPEVISAIYKTMEQMGFREGNLLEIIIPSLIQRNGIIKKYPVTV